MKIDVGVAGSDIKLCKSTRDNEMPGLKFGDCGLSKTPLYHVRSRKTWVW